MSKKNQNRYKAEKRFKEIERKKKKEKKKEEKLVRKQEDSESCENTDVKETE